MNKLCPVFFASVVFLAFLLEGCGQSVQTLRPSIVTVTQIDDRFGKNRLLVLSSERNVDYAPQSSFTTVISISDPEMLHRQIAYTSDDGYWNTTEIAGSTMYGEKILVAKKRINELWMKGGSLDFLDLSAKVNGRNPLEIAGLYYYQACFLPGTSDFVYLAYDSKTDKTSIYYSFEVDNLTIDESLLGEKEPSGFIVSSKEFNGYYYFNVDGKIFREVRRISRPTENISYILPSMFTDKVFYVENGQIKWASLVDDKFGFLMNDPGTVEGFRTFISMSPNATKITYRLLDEDFEVLHIADMSGGDIATKRIDGSVFWSPDSVSLLIESKSKSPVIWNIDTEAITVLSMSDWEEFGVPDDYYSAWGFPSQSPWSPDGKYLLFKYSYDYSKSADIVDLSTMKISPIVVDSLMVNNTKEFVANQIIWAGGK